MAKTQGQSAVRRAASALLSAEPWARALRILLVFTLTFWVSFHMLHRTAYGLDYPSYENSSLSDAHIEKVNPDASTTLSAGGTIELKVLATWTETTSDGGEVEHKDENVTHLMKWGPTDGSISYNFVEGDVQDKNKVVISITSQAAAGALDITCEPESTSIDNLFADDASDYIPIEVMGIYTLYYDGNGGDGSMQPETGSSVTVAGCGFTAPKGKSFAGWQDASGMPYEVGETVTLSDDLTLYAQWENEAPSSNSSVVDSIEILTSDGKTGIVRELDGRLSLKVAEGESATYEFQANVVVIPDYENDPSTKKTFTCTPSKTLASWAADEGLDLPDPTWTYEIISSEDDAGGVAIDGETGIITIGSGMEVRVTCMSYAGVGGGATGDAVIVDTTGGESTEGYKITYLANNGTDEKAEATVPYGESATIAECTFTAPDVEDADDDTAGGTGGSAGGATGGTGASGGTNANETPGGGSGAGADGKTDDSESPSDTSTTVKVMRFSSWNTEKDGSGTKYLPGDSITPDDDVTLYAQWVEGVANVYTLTYDANGGTGKMDPVKGIEGVPFAVAACEFTGPVDESSSPSQDGKEDEDADADEGASGGTGSGQGMNTQDDDESDTGTGAGGGAGDSTGGGAEEDDDTGTGGGSGSGSSTGKHLTFKSWNTRPDGSGTKYLPGDPITLTANTTLYARWTDDDVVDGNFKIIYDANGGTGEMEPSVAVDGVATVKECEFVAPKGRTFMGWSTRLNGADAAYKPGTKLELKANTTLYAQWGRGNEFGVEIDYTPVDIGEWALLTGIAFGTGESSFGFVWYTSSDGGATWNAVTGKESYVNNKSPQTLRLKTSGETIGMLVKAKVQTSDKREAESDPVTIVKGNSNLLISYEPVNYGETALFSLTSKLQNAKYQWQVSHDNTTTWEDISGATGMTLAVPTIEGNLGSFYRAIAVVEGQEKLEESNALMLTATTDDPGFDDPTQEEGDGGDDTSPGVTPPDSGGSGGSGDTSPDVTPPSDTSPDTSPPVDSSPNVNPPTDTSPNVTPPTDTSPDVTQPTYAPAQTPQSNQQIPQGAIPVSIVVPEYPNADPGKQTVIVDPEVQRRISEGEIITQEEQEARTPGARWRKLDLVPEPEEVQELLADNPFAAFALPSFIGIVAAGALERVLSYRRQKRFADVKFDSGKKD